MLHGGIGAPWGVRGALGWPSREIIRPFWQKRAREPNRNRNRFLACCRSREAFCGLWLVSCLCTNPHSHGRSNGALGTLGCRAMALSWSCPGPILVVSQGFPRMNLRSVAGQARLGRRSKAGVMVLATGVISGDVSSSFKAIEFGPPFVLSNHNDCDGGCDIEPGGLCRQRQKSRGVVVECSYCVHAFHLRCLASTVRDKVMDSQGHWAYDSSCGGWRRKRQHV